MDAGVTFQMSVHGAGWIVFPYTTLFRSFSADVTLVSGTHNLTVRTIDTAGNTTAGTAAQAYTLDTTAPVAQATITAIADDTSRSEEKTTDLHTHDNSVTRRVT